MEDIPVDKDSCKLKALFLELFLDESKNCSNRSKALWLLDYVRLSILAHRF
jgi:hypothetical protein